MSELAVQTVLAHCPGAHWVTGRHEVAAKPGAKVLTAHAVAAALPLVAL